MRSFLRAIQWVEEAILSCSVLAVAILTIANVLSRSLLNTSLAATEELCQFLMVIITFVGLSYAVSRARHIRMTALYDVFGYRTRQTLAVIICGTSAILMFFLAYLAFRYAMVVRTLGSVSPALQVPLYMIYLTAPLGLALAGTRYAFTMVRNLMEPGLYLSFTIRDPHENGPGKESPQA